MMIFVSLMKGNNCDDICAINEREQLRIYLCH